MAWLEKSKPDAQASRREPDESLDGVIESNYDAEMLEAGYFSESLKRRIRGSGGHLSNEDSAKLLNECDSDRMRWACLCHLSEGNNNEETAVRTHQKWLGDDFPIFVDSRTESTKPLRL